MIHILPFLPASFAVESNFEKHERIQLRCDLVFIPYAPSVPITQIWLWH